MVSKKHVTETQGRPKEGTGPGANQYCGAPLTPCGACGTPAKARHGLGSLLHLAGGEASVLLLWHGAEPQPPGRPHGRGLSCSTQLRRAPQSAGPGAVASICHTLGTALQRPIP